MNDATTGRGKVSRRQAWQFALVPMEAKGDDLHVMSTAEHAARAARFVRRVLGMRACVHLVSDATLVKRLLRDFGFSGTLPHWIRPGRARWSSTDQNENGNSRI